MTSRTIAPLTVSIAIALVAGLFHSSDASAQSYNHPAYRPHSRAAVEYQRGFYFGAGAAGTRILAQDGGNELLEDGVGVALYAGLRVNRSLALEAGWMGTMHNPVSVDTGFGEDTDYLVLNGFTADAKVFLNVSNPRLQPYLQAGVGLYLLDSTYFGTQSVGSGFQAGGGLDFQISRRMDIGAHALYRGMAMGPPDVDYNDTYVSAITLEGRVNFRF